MYQGDHFRPAPKEGESNKIATKFPEGETQNLLAINVFFYESYFHMD